MGAWFISLCFVLQEPSLERFFSFTQTFRELFSSFFTVIHFSWPQNILFWMPFGQGSERWGVIHPIDVSRVLTERRRELLRWWHGNEQKRRWESFPQDTSSLAGEPAIENHMSTDGVTSHRCHKEACRERPRWGSWIWEDGSRKDVLEEMTYWDPQDEKSWGTGPQEKVTACVGALTWHV